MKPPSIHPSMLFLVGTQDWKTLQQLIQVGVYDNILSDSIQMSTVITFAVAYHAPFHILHFLCHLNPDSLLISDVPFRLARRTGSCMQTFIALESARQRATVMNSANDD
jgi:hypothetical protein